MGPYLVIDDKMERAVKIQQNPKSEPKVVHIDSLKKFQGDPPQEIWIKWDKIIDPELDSRKGGETLSQNTTHDPLTENNIDEEEKFEEAELSLEEIIKDSFYGSRRNRV